MLSEKDIKQELFNAEYLRKLYRNTSAISSRYWIAGYIVALEVIMQKTNSEIISKIKENISFEDLQKILKIIE